MSVFYIPSWSRSYVGAAKVINSVLIPQVWYKEYEKRPFHEQLSCSKVENAHGPSTINKE